MSKAGDYGASKVKPGDYLLLAYGNGTQLVFVIGIINPIRANAVTKLRIQRLYYRTKQYAGPWKHSAPIKADDVRILGFAKPYPDTPLITEVHQ
jgi:hypothetical protein